VSSGAHTHTSIDFEDLQAERGYDPRRVYSRTKLANVLFTYELARRLQGTRVTVNCLNPGIVATRMLADYMGLSASRTGLSRTFGATPDEGAETSIYLASAPEMQGVTGKYFERKRPVTSSRESYDAATARRLWEISERLTGVST
jgi:NAD(P)-dependent dehydrogenase (short-subunit alcohol dehydrogenase family)